MGAVVMTIYAFCPVCGLCRPVDGPHGLFRHVVMEHPESALAVAILQTTTQGART
jgi:hypothetical protein